MRIGSSPTYFESWIGCHLIASNADLPEVRSLYRGYGLRALDVRRQVNVNVAGRPGHSELLITKVRRPAVQLELPVLGVETAAASTRSAPNSAGSPTCGVMADTL
jgi:hypothetical protein